jgi:Ca-activated chloride channel family protein
MSFMHPEFLYYMLPVVIILFALLLTQKDPQKNFFSDEVMAKLQVSANTLTLQARNAIFFVITVLIIIALADPVIKDGKVEVKEKSADIMMALDISDSMLAEDVYPNRLKLAKQKALELLRLAPNERIGVIAFAQNSYLVSPLSFDHEAVRFLLANLDTTSITEQGTNFLSMLHVVDRSIKNDAKKYLLILSDGGDAKDFSKEISFAKEHGIVVFVLGMGTPQGAPIKMKNGEFIKQNGKIIISRLNENVAKLATETGGVYIQNVNSNEDIKRMLQEIENHSKQKELKSQEIEKYIPLFYYPVGLALFLLLIATSSMSKRVKVEVPAAFIGLFLLFHANVSRAGVLDFVELHNAKNAYEQKNYKEAAQKYIDYAKKAENSTAYYNAGNALYKMGKYKEAAKLYEKSYFPKSDEKAKLKANLGNAYAKQGDTKSLQKALKEYEASLKIRKDKDVEENLEMVKKELEKRKKQQQKQNKKNNKNDKENKKQNEDKQNKEKENKGNKDKKDSKNKKKNQKQEQQNKQDKKDSQGKSDKNDKKKSERKSKKQSQEESKNQQQDAKKKKEEKKESQEAKKEPQKKKNKKEQEDKAKELKNKDEKKNTQKKTAQLNAAHVKDKMSDAEEKKWLQRLNKRQSSYLYMLNNNQNRKENPNEKPW